MMPVVRRTITRSAALAAIAVLSMALVACSGGSGQGGGNGGETAQSLAEKTQYNPQPYENIKDGGTLTTSLPEISPQFNTFQTDGTAYTLAVWRWYNPILITFTADGDAVYNPDYLTDVKQETVDGNTRITYTINPKATYNDGSPIDWRSFESTWKTSNGTDPAYLVSSTDGYDRITSVVRGVDDRQAVVTFQGDQRVVAGPVQRPAQPRRPPTPPCTTRATSTTRTTSGARARTRCRSSTSRTASSSSSATRSGGASRASSTPGPS